MGFTHVDENNKPTMVDVSHKLETAREAHARGQVWLPQIVRDQFVDGDLSTKKGPVFSCAIIAGTMAVKKTSELIPFCHQINIESTKINIQLVGENAVIDCKVKTFGKTGVEMEAIVGVNIAAATIYDMCKAFGHEMIINDIQLISKTGGKSDFSKGE
ncbi:MAG: cyclic pyranopterin monophosphate synthase MoaC [Gammaproteobacteria bacterium]|nr:MAG: cyclic pyranopterin monophosphate synthase MoaC [Gammaproteobacteria bacterium]